MSDRHANVIVRPDPGRAMRYSDRYPGISDTGDLLPIDPDIPAAPGDTDDVISVLKQIRNRLPDPALSPSVFDLQVQTIPVTTAGVLTFQTDRPAKWVFVPVVPRVMIVYAGIGRLLRLASLTQGQSLNARLPNGARGIEIDYDTGAVNDQVTVLFTGTKFEVEVTG